MATHTHTVECGRTYSNKDANDSSQSQPSRVCESQTLLCACMSKNLHRAHARTPTILAACASTLQRVSVLCVCLQCLPALSFAALCAGSKSHFRASAGGSKWRKWNWNRKPTRTPAPLTSAFTLALAAVNIRGGGGTAPLLMDRTANVSSGTAETKKHNPVNSSLSDRSVSLEGH